MSGRHGPEGNEGYCWCGFFVGSDSAAWIRHLTPASPPPADALRAALERLPRFTPRSWGDGGGMGPHPAGSWLARTDVLAALAAAPAPGLDEDWRKAIADRPGWIGWDTVFCYWCDNTESQGHASDCVWVKAVRLAGGAE